MSTNNWRPTPPSGEPTMDTVDWRTQLQPDSRLRIVNKIMDTLKKHLPFSSREGLNELEKIAKRFEEKIFMTASRQSDYLRIISLKMLTMETKSHNTIPNAGNNLPIQNLMDASSSRPTPTPPSGEPPVETVDWRTQLRPDSRARIVNKIVDTLKRHLPFSHQEDLNGIRNIAVRFEEKIFVAASSQSDYLRRISLKMLTMESRHQNQTICIGMKRKRIMAP